MWGIHLFGSHRFFPFRFIPTHVGNTSTRRNGPEISSVHPHACGEYGISNRYQCARHRFIPTHVGNTTPDWPRRGHRPVHPHACGEYHFAQDKSHEGRGSSPRMWGIPLRTGPGEVIGRFIPTHVGNRPFPGRLKGPNSVHPHACGEYEARAPAMIPAIGSSPRMWGIHRDSARLPRSHPVHPHACGEYWTVPGDTVFSPGSSPRMWGIHHSGLRGPDGQRFIPTHVGNTFNLLLLHV